MESGIGVHEPQSNSPDFPLVRGLHRHGQEEAVVRRQTLEDLEVIVLKVVIVLTIVFCSVLWVLDIPVSIR